jgi:hypothetical protein
MAEEERHPEEGRGRGARPTPEPSGTAVQERPQPAGPGQPPAQGDEQAQATAARAQFDADMARQRAEAERAIREPRMIGMETRDYVPPPNARMVRAGPMTMRFAVGGLPIFQRYGKRYEVVGSADGGGVLAVDLEGSEPKTVYYLKAPQGDEQEQAPE